MAEYQKQWLALIGWQSGAFKCRPRDRWIGWRPQQQFPRLRLLCPPGAVHNLASCVMAANLRRLSADWQEAYGHPLELAETFVDPKRFAGTLSSGRKLGGGRAHPRLFPQQRPLHQAPRPHQDDGASIPCAPERGNGCAIPSRAPPGSRSGRRRCAPQRRPCPRCCRSSRASRITVEPRAASSSCPLCWPSGRWLGCPVTGESMPLSVLPAR